MFEIHPAADDKALALANKEGLDLPLFAMVLQDGGEESGYILYRLYEDTVSLLCCRCEDADLAEWLVRAALNAAANRNALNAVCTDETLFSLLVSLGFTSEDGRMSMFIPDFFNRPGSGCCSEC